MAKVLLAVAGGEMLAATDSGMGRVLLVEVYSRTSVMEDPAAMG
jgi:hypothetical protein